MELNEPKSAEKIVHFPVRGKLTPFSTSEPWKKEKLSLTLLDTHPWFLLTRESDLNPTSLTSILDPENSDSWISRELRRLAFYSSKNCGNTTVQRPWKFGSVIRRAFQKLSGRSSRIVNGVTWRMDG